MLAKRGPAAERYKFLLWAYILPTVATRGDMSAALCAITVAHTWPHGVLQPSASGPLIGRGKTVSGLHGSAVLVQCGSADVGPIKYGRACPVPRRRGRPGGGPLWEFEIGPPLGQRDIAVWAVLSRKNHENTRLELMTYLLANTYVHYSQSALEFFPIHCPDGRLGQDAWALEDLPLP